MSQGNNPLFTLSPGLELVLLSSSPRRKELLASLDLPFTVHMPEATERPPESGETPQEYALAMARIKGNFSLSPQAVAISADTVVAVREQILGKPHNAQEALEMLELLNGRDHQVYTAVQLILPDGDKPGFVKKSDVFFHHWPGCILQSYANCGEPLDKAGAYAVQGRGAFLIDRIQGSFTNVVGLPMTDLIEALLRKKIIRPRATP